MLQEGSTARILSPTYIIAIHVFQARGALWGRAEERLGVEQEGEMERGGNWPYSKNPQDLVLHFLVLTARFVSGNT